jgi:hypothetical protein
VINYYRFILNSYEITMFRYIFFKFLSLILYDVA